MISEYGEALKMSILSIGIERGRVEGRTAGLAEATLELLEEYGEIPGKMRLRILEEKNLDVLKSWHKKAAKVRSIEEFQNYLE